jgi:hypothetical protein
MSREKIAKYMINYLEERINCENVMKFADKTLQSKLGEGKEAVINKLMVENIPVAFKVMKYNDTEGYEKKNKTDANDRIWVKNMFDTFDLMTEANYTGFEYFPYIYGVLNCHEKENSNIYIYYEVFDGSLIDLINNITHPSEWYDIVFQMIMINYYIEIINGYRYNDGTVQNHLYKKLEKPYYKEYHINSHKFNINHRYLIVLWDINYIEKITDKNKNQITSNINFLLRYINENKEKIKIPPSGRIIKLLHEVKNNTKDTINILSQYYTQNENK